MPNARTDREARMGGAGERNGAVISEIEVVHKVDEGCGEGQVSQGVQKEVVAEAGKGRRKVEEDCRGMLIFQSVEMHSCVDFDNIRQK